MFVAEDTINSLLALFAFAKGESYLREPMQIAAPRSNQPNVQQIVYKG